MKSKLLLIFFLFSCSSDLEGTWKGKSVYKNCESDYKITFTSDLYEEVIYFPDTCSQMASNFGNVRYIESGSFYNTSSTVYYNPLIAIIYKENGDSNTLYNMIRVQEPYVIIGSSMYLNGKWLE